MKFPVLWICGLILWIGSARVHAWGGLFNRFSPEMLSNMGYGSSHGGSSYRPQPLFQVIQTVTRVLDIYAPLKRTNCSHCSILNTMILSSSEG